ncbi:hypothetical protein TNCV_906271 [Trichonephila clavipes]|nr:hypothetical protein TNCV_906271 [Trichonephila clavipes]
MSEITSLSLFFTYESDESQDQQKGTKLSDQQEGIWIGQNVKEATFFFGTTLTTPFSNWMVHHHTGSQMSEITSLSLFFTYESDESQDQQKGTKLSDQQEGIWIGQNVKEATFLGMRILWLMPQL